MKEPDKEIEKEEEIPYIDEIRIPGCEPITYSELFERMKNGY